jgi:hypothetical protein
MESKVGMLSRSGVVAQAGWGCDRVFRVACRVTVMKSGGNDDE